jgi:uncharacterized SAM-binding protein YcdF (DUF218 family)
MILLLVFGVWLASLIGVLVWGRRDGARPASAIVVLGAAQYAGRPSPVLRARLDHAVLLWERRLAPRLVLTGGMGDGDTTSEAAVGRRYVMKRGVPDSAILIEAQGRTTSESLRRVAGLMESQPSRGVILVSDPFHMLRLAILARRYGMVPYTSPTRTSPISANRSESWRYSLGESLKVPLALILERGGP